MLGLADVIGRQCGVSATSDLTEPQPPPADERVEVLDLAMRLLTGDMSNPTEPVMPMDGPECAAEIARRHDMTTRNAWRYVRRARELIASEFEADRPHRARGLALISLSVVREASRDRNWTGVNGAVKNLCTIYGIDAKVTIKGDGLSALVDAIKTSPAARDDEIAALEAKEREGIDDGSEPS